MTKRKNEFGIKCLLMYPAFQIVDPVTQAPLQLKVTVEFFPGAFLPEFVEAQNSIRQLIDRQKITLDAAACGLIDFFNEYQPKGVKVKVDVINNNTFFPVSVIAERGDFGVGGDVFLEGKKKPAEKAQSMARGKGDTHGDEEEGKDKE